MIPPTLQIAKFPSLTFLPPFPQPDLIGRVRLQVIMHDLEVLERGEEFDVRQRSPDQKFQLSGILQQPVARIDADFMTHRSDHATYFPLEIRGIVDHVEIGVAHPRSGRIRI